MRLHSSRDPRHTARLSEAIERGLAPDGGLYIPDSLPHPAVTAAALPDVAQNLLREFFAGDALESSLPAIAKESLNFPAPLVPLQGAPGTVEVLELFHGPTAAFKDFGARFLAACFERLREKPLTILVATSGDTGGAVAAAFHRKPWAQVIVLFPKGLVSPRQEKQLTCWDTNVTSLAVRGTFDDCQRLVKTAFLDAEVKAARDLSSANSINIGRLLPQAVYYAASSLDVKQRTGRGASYIIPSGNLGNVMACIWARTMGLPIEEIVLAHNANRTVPDYLETGDWKPRPSVATLASAMDVGDPSNMERLRSLHPTVEALRKQVRAVSVSDDEIRARIRNDYKNYGRIWCPHTAVAAEAYARLSREEQQARHWVFASTAHPAKFSETIEPLIGRAVDVPPSLAALLALPSRSTDIDSDFASLKRILLSSPSQE